MADIELVIKIDEEQYKFISEGMSIDKVIAYPALMHNICERIANGTPLPKGHSYLKDIGECNRKLFYQQCGGSDSLITVKSAFDMLLALPTILKSDKESEDKE